MKNKQLQTKQQSMVNASPAKLSLDELSQISAGALSGKPRPDDLVTPTIPDWRYPGPFPKP